MDVTRRQFVESLVASAALSLAGCATRDARSARAGAAVPSGPNVVVILADDLGRECLGAYGGTSYATPALDRMARDGMRFERCFAMPMCHPSRLTLLTGRYPFRTNARWGTLPESELTLGQMFERAGYATALSGKWQMAKLADQPDHVARSGFATSACWGWREGPRYAQPVIWVDGARRDDLAARWGPDVHTEFLLEFIERNAAGPFLGFFSMTLPHFENAELEDYATLVAEMDRDAGRVLDALDRLALSERTLVLFMADNGTPQRVVSRLGAREIRGGKSTLLDAGTHVPLLARWPGMVPAGSVCTDLVDLSDLLPTLAQVAEIPLPADVPLDGTSFARQLRGAAGVGRSWVYGGLGERGYVRETRWKLYSSGELFDLEADPDEHVPISASADSAEAAAARARLTATFAQLGF